jgi:hypothetical protein
MIIFIKYIMSIPLLFQLKLNGIKIFMHGEEHRNIDNSYYEGLSKSFRQKDFILVEHSTNACELKPEEEHLFIEHAKGSEWIFYTQKKAGNPNILCFDTRSEDGYLNAFAEQRLLTLGDSLPTCKPQEIREYIDGVIHILKAFNDNSEKFKTAIPGYFERSLETLQSQFNVVIHLLKLKKREGDKFPKMLSDILSGAGYTLATNLRRLASVSVDINLASVLTNLTDDMTKGSNVHVFCGRNHVIRMAIMFNLPLNKFTRDHIKTAEMEVQGDLETDAKILKIQSE